MRDCNSSSPLRQQRSRIHDVSIAKPDLFSSLPDEIVWDILLRLPLKNLSMCRYVCKSWFHIIKSPHFTRSRSTHITTILLRNPSGEGDLCFIEFNRSRNDPACYNLTVINLNSHFDGFPLKQNVVGSCNGLLCLTAAEDKYNDAFIVCNLVTGDYMKLPPVPVIGLSRGPCGFGYDSVNDTYKVIGIWYHNMICFDECCTGGEIYVIGLGEDTWRTIGEVPHPFFVGMQMVFVEGALHWPYNHNFGSKIDCIVSFDVNHERFQLLPGPPSPKYHTGCRFTLVELGGCLCSYDFFAGEFVIWMMMEYGVKESWMKKYVVPKDVCVHGWPLSLMKHGEILLLAADNNSLRFYDPVMGNGNPIDDDKLPFDA